MKTIKHINSFMFQRAQYLLSDGRSGSAVLKVDYAGNTYEISDSSTVDEAFKAEIHRVAQDLLKRKHGVNFVSRLMITE